MPVTTPPEIALREFLGSSTRHIRRAEIYEADGVTRWSKDTVVRLKDGTINVDYDRDERRTIDLVLANEDGVLVNAPEEFWYDKIIKVFRGVRINEPTRIPRVLIISDLSGDETLASSFRDALVTSGFGDVLLNTTAYAWGDVANFDILVGLGAAVESQIELFRDAYREGKSVYLQDADAAAWIDLMWPESGFMDSTATSVVPIAGSPHPASKAWMAWDHIAGTSTVHQFVTTQATPIVLDGTDDTYSKITAFQEPIRGGRAITVSAPFDFNQYDVPQVVNMLSSFFTWLNTVRPMLEWECQVGEFMIDRITEKHFPYDVSLTGRDYTKKCLGSKFLYATQFASGMSLESIIASIAGAAGITKRSLPATGVVVGREFFFDRGVSRWEAMKEIATAYDHEIYFDATGFLILRPFRDPVSTSPVLTLKTGMRDGQLVGYDKSTSDSRIYNVILVTGESSDASNPPVYGVARNDDPASPTSTVNIGERVYTYTSSFITTTDQALAVANSFLAVHALEEFELSFSSLMLPWLEVGDIIGWLDPRPAPGDPSTFLLGTLTIPLGLAPMDGSARRVTNVS